MIDLFLVKKDTLRYVQHVMTLKGIGRGLLDHRVVLCYARLVVAWIRRRDVVDGARRVRSEKLKKHQYREGYARTVERKRLE